MLRAVIDIPRWLFLGVLIYAPWAYGCTPPWTIAVLETLLSIILLLWLTGCAMRRMKPLVHPVMFGCMVFLLAQGWGMTLNPHYRDNGNYRFLPITALLPWSPGSVDEGVSSAMMLRVGGLLATACFVCDLAARREWRRRIWWTAGATGISIVLFGLFQRASGRPLLFWEPADMAMPLFATYYYHGNAGAFINLVLPLIAGLAILSLRKPDSYLSRAVWLPGFFVCAAGAFVNVSRSAMVVTILAGVILLAWQFPGSSREALLPPHKLRLVYATLMAAVLVCLVAFSGWERPVEKWSMLESQLNSSNRRLISTRVCLRMAADSGWHGFGPGTFQLVFPHYTGSHATEIPGIWRYAHNDYLQTLIEWGWLGAVPWAVLFFGALIKLFVNGLRKNGAGTSDRILLFTSALALTGVALHALVDFPLQIASLQLYAATYIGFGWGSNLWTNKQSSIVVRHPGSVITGSFP